MSEKEMNSNRPQAEANTSKNDIRIKADTNSTQPNKNMHRKKSKARMYIVLLFILVVSIVGYVIYRGEYLEILEMGEEYISIFWQNVNYSAITFGINFLVLFIIIYMNNNRIKKALKQFLKQRKRRCQNFQISH